MHSNIPPIRSLSSLSNLSNTSVPKETSPNASPSVSERRNEPVPAGSPSITSTGKTPSEIREEKQADTSSPSSPRFLSKKTTSLSPLQVEFLKEKTASEGESTSQHPSLLRQFSLPLHVEFRKHKAASEGESSSQHPSLLRQFSLHDANSGRNAEGDTAVHIDDSHPATPSTSSSSSRRTTRSIGLPDFATSAPSWLTRNSVLRKTGVVLGETINHATIAAIVWGTISPLINRANGASSVDGGDFKGNYRIAVLNVLAMVPVSIVLTNVLFAVLRGIMGYRIEKAQLDEAFSDPDTVARLKAAQKDSDYNGAIADVLYSSVFGAGMVAGSQIPAWAKEAGLSENNQQIVNSAIQMGIAAAALAMVRTTMMLSRTVDGQPTYEAKSLGHHNPLKNLAERFKATTHTKRKDEPANISPTYRAMRNLVLRMCEEASVWGGATLYSAPAGISTNAVRHGASNPVTQFLNGYMTVTLGYFFDEGNSLHRARIDEDFSPWKFLGAWNATKDLILPDFPPPNSTVRAVRESAGMATTAQSILKDMWNIGQRVLHAKNVATVYGPRIFLDAATSVEHEIVNLLAHYQQYCPNQTSSVRIEEIDSSEAAQTQDASTSSQTDDEEAVSHIAEAAPTGTHENPTPSSGPTQQSRTSQNPGVQIEEIDSPEAAQPQDASTSSQAGNEEAVSHINQAAPADIDDKEKLA